MTDFDFTGRPDAFDPNLDRRVEAVQMQLGLVLAYLTGQPSNPALQCERDRLYGRLMALHWHVLLRDTVSQLGPDGRRN